MLCAHWLFIDDCINSVTSIFIALNNLIYFLGKRGIQQVHNSHSKYSFRFYLWGNRTVFYLFGGRSEVNTYHSITKPLKHYRIISGKGHACIYLNPIHKQRIGNRKESWTKMKEDKALLPAFITISTLSSHLTLCCLLAPSIPWLCLDTYKHI